MYDDDFPMTQNLVAKAMRHQIIDKSSLIARLLELDADMDNDELCAEILRLCLFDRTQRRNPVNVFLDKLNNGDFLLIQPDEDPDNLRPGREPMTDEMLDAAADKVNADATYWDGKATARVADIVRSVILAA